MESLRYIISGLLFIIFLWVAICNLWIIVRYYLKKQPGSTIPLIGGLSGVLALFVIPFNQLRSLWWIPLVIDWGSLPLVVTYLISLIKGKRENSQKFR